MNILTIGDGKNHNYGKLIDGVLELSPAALIVGDRQYIGNDSTKYANAGYSPIIYADKPEDTDTGHYEAVYTETDGQIIQAWEFVSDIPKGFLDTSKIENWDYFNYTGLRNAELQKSDTSGGKWFNRVCYGAGDLIELELNCPLARDFVYGFYDCVYMTDLVLHLGDGTNGTHLIRDIDFQNAFRNMGALVNFIVTGKISITSKAFNIAYASSLSLESMESIAEAIESSDNGTEHAIYLDSVLKNDLLNADNLEYELWKDKEGEEEGSGEKRRLRYKKIIDTIDEKNIGLG